MSVLEHEVQAERELSEAFAALVGKWVAVRDHKIVASADTLHELLSQVGDEPVDGMFEVVDEESGAASFF